MGKRISERLADWFGTDSQQKKAKAAYEGGKEAQDFWKEIPEDKRGVKFHTFQSFLSNVWKKTEKGGKRPRSGQKKKS